MAKRILVTGGTGLIGQALGRAILERKDRLIVVARDTVQAGNVFQKNAQIVAWQGAAGSTFTDWIAGADAVVHLAASSVGGRRWTESYKAGIMESRVGLTRTLVDTILAAPVRPGIFVSMSGIGYYGDRGAQPVDESSAPGTDFLAEVCTAWEAEALRAALATRVVIPRTAVVLSGDSGALPLLARPFRWFVGGPIGSGRQYFPWIHIDDVVSFLLRAIDNEDMSGVYNLCAPVTITNSAFSTELGRVLGRPSWLPVPAPVLRLVVGEFADTLLGGQNTLPRRLTQEGFDFAFPSARMALENLL